MQVNNILNRLRINKSSAIITIIVVLVVIFAAIGIILQGIFKPKDAASVFLTNLKVLNFDKLKNSTDETGKSYINDFEKFNDDLLSIVVDGLNFKFNKEDNNNNLQIQFYDLNKYNDLIKEELSDSNNYENGNLNKNKVIDDIRAKLKNDIKNFETNLITDNDHVLGESKFFAQIKEIFDDSLLNTDELISKTLTSSGNSELSSSSETDDDSKTSDEVSKNTGISESKNKSDETKDNVNNDSNAKTAEDINNPHGVSNNNSNEINTNSSLEAAGENNNNDNTVNYQSSNSNENTANINGSNNIDYSINGTNNNYATQNNPTNVANVAIGSYYTINQGDDLVEIARRAYAGYDNPELYVYKIIEANDLNDIDGVFYLYVGQVIYIPVP